MPTFKDSARTTAQVFLLIAGSTVFSQATTVAQLPAAITEAFSGMGQVQFLLMLNILLLIVGCFFGTSAAILILAPMLMPTAEALGIAALHLGMVFVVNLAIGLFTPPLRPEYLRGPERAQAPHGRHLQSVRPLYHSLYHLRTRDLLCPRTDHHAARHDDGPVILKLETSSL